MKNAKEKTMIPKWPKRLATLTGWCALVILLIPLFFAFADAVHQAHAANHEAADYENSYGYIFRLTFSNWGQFFQTYGGALTLFATAVIACFNWFLVDSTNRLWDAGERQLQHSEMTAKRQLRAYIAPSERRLEIDMIQHTVRAHIGIRNFGQTPAHHVNVESGIVVIQPPIAADMSITFQRNAWSDSAFPIHPGEVVPISTTTTARFNTDVRSEIVERSKAIFVAGQITYKDIFGDDHITDFLYWLVGDDALKDLRLSVYRQGNRAT